jgi:hypothetical protein
MVDIGSNIQSPACAVARSENTTSSPLLPVVHSQSGNHRQPQQGNAYSFSSTAVGTDDLLALDRQTFRIMISLHCILLVAR